MDTGSQPVLPRFKDDASRARYLEAYDAALRAWPVPYETRTIPTRFGPTHVVVSGPPDAPSLILLPSFAATASVWRPNAAALSPQFRIYAIDVIGQPGKSIATTRLRSRRDYADWLREVMDALGVARASIAGCSFGGFLALSQAALTPDRVERVVLIGPVGTLARMSWRIILKMITGPLRRRLRRLFGDTREPSLADVTGARGPLDPHDDAWRALMSATMRESPKVSTIPAAVLSDAELQAVRAPVLLLIGEKEMLYDPPSMLALAKRRMPGLRGAIIGGADHIAAMAQPDAVHAHILPFLGEDGRAGIASPS